MTSDEIIEKAIDKAIEAGKTSGFEEGDIVACRSDKYTYAFLRVEGDEAVVEIAPKRRSPGSPTTKKFRLDEIFNVDLFEQFTIEVKAQAVAEEVLGEGATCVIVKIG